MSGHWLAELGGSSVTVEVPGSSANLGAGYDCVGIALAMINRIEVEVRVWSRGAIELTVEGEGRDELPADRENRFIRGLEATLRAARGELHEGVGWRITMRNQIPLARGLGSSAAATVGGVLVGNALAGGFPRAVLEEVAEVAAAGGAGDLGAGHAVAAVGVQLDHLGRVVEPRGELGELH